MATGTALVEMTSLSHTSVPSFNSSSSRKSRAFQSSFLQFPFPREGFGYLSPRSPRILTARASVTAVIEKDSSVAAGVKRKKYEKPIVVIDNYDSFTYNLCQYMGELGCNYDVYRNDELSVEDLKMKDPRGILISPGPGEPKESGISLQTVLELGPTVPLFGVCMGLQCIGEAFGGKIVRAPYGVMHGKSSPVYFDEKDPDGLFSGLPNPFEAARYHSLVIEKESFPSEALEITAWTEDGLIMAARHRKYKHLQGVQFHPESILTTEGRTIVRNFVRMIERKESEDAAAVPLRGLVISSEGLN